MIDRRQRIEDFLAANGWRPGDVRPLADDASFRSYHRLEAGGRMAVMMDAPPEHEDVRPFVTIARHLLNLGLSAPRILAEDAETGLLLLEDLGDDTFTGCSRMAPTKPPFMPSLSTCSSIYTGVHRHKPCPMERPLTTMTACSTKRCCLPIGTCRRFSALHRPRACATHMFLRGMKSFP